jgi:methyl-accepting chemotaxis protein
MSDGIRAKAEKGSEQMNAMMEAVQAINDASQSIGKVIKVIDDIAFQTNILALNAAVEAARAGVAGRGFAVVAEEVRNLAAKSAEAAQDTEALIENSINKAVLGVKIAGETNESLIAIVDGIVQSSRISGEIAEKADRQYSAIGEINTGIDQVSQVVQQNSATAEESAAASEELSGQSSMLNGLIGQFKLSGAGAYLPHAEANAINLDAYTPRIALDNKEHDVNYDKY